MLADTGAHVNRTTYIRRLRDWQSGINEGTLGFQKLNALDCLERYATFDRDASDLILISSDDTLAGSSNVMESNNSLLAVEYFGSVWASGAQRDPLWGMWPVQQL